MNENVYSRERFAYAFGSITNGFSTRQVLSLLGRPDDIRTSIDGDIGLLAETKEMWCYGTDRHLGFPTLGHLYLSDRGLVHHHHTVELPQKLLCQMFDESELRQVLAVIDQSPAPNDTFHPRQLVQVVNQLLAFGKEKVIAAISEYLRVAPLLATARGGIFLVLRALFDFPLNSEPPPRLYLGQPFPPRTWEEMGTQRFPLVLEGDIPLLLVLGHRLRGEPGAVESHLCFYQTNYPIRHSPLRPTDRPFSVLDVIQHAAPTAWVEGDAYLRGWLISQLLLLVDTVYNPVRPDSFFGMDVAEQNHWLTRFDHECVSIGLHWDCNSNRYRIAQEQ